MVNTSKTSLPHQPFPSWLMPTSRSSVLSPLLQPTHQSISQLVKAPAAAAAEGMEMLITALSARAARNNTPGLNCPRAPVCSWAGSALPRAPSAAPTDRVSSETLPRLLSSPLNKML